MAPVSLKFGLLAGLMLALCVDAKKKKGSKTSDVLALTSENFEATLKETENILVAFTAPWCGHCKKLKPEFEGAATELKEEGLKLANVDATQEQELASRFEVQGYPTIKFFKGGKPQEYNGPRDKAGIVAWLRRKSGPAAAAVTTLAEAEALAARSDVVIIGFVNSADSDLGKAILSVAAESEDVVFGFVPADKATELSALRAKYGVEGEGVVAVNNFEGEDNVVRHPDAGAIAAAPAELTKWMNAHSLPRVVTFSQETAPKIFRGPLKTHLLLFADSEAEAGSEDEKAIAAFRTAAADSAARQTALFVIVPPSEDRIMGYFDVKADELPRAILVSMGDAGLKKYLFAEGASYGEASAYISFAASFAAGELKPFLKSEPAPDAAANDAAAVRVITGKTFQADVIDNDKDVLLEVYAPWCGHCKKLAPTWEALGKAVADAGLKDIITIAKMDGTTNEVDYPGMEVKGFPTILFFPAGNKATPTDYEGSRDAEGLVAFLRKNSGHADRASKLDAAAVKEEGEGEEDEE